MNRKQEQALEAIQNFILWYASDETERNRMREAAVAYVEEDHVLTEEDET
jgi:hypothetical protein